MLPTPSTSHVNIDRIYEPAEDSYLLLDTLSSASETLFLSQRFCAPLVQYVNTKASSSPLVLEVGTGSGVVLAFLTAHAQQIFGRRDVLCLGTDVNRFACQATEQTILQACKDASEKPEEVTSAAYLLASLNADLISCIRAETVDLLVFNPPYVPTSDVPAVPADHSHVNQAPVNVVHSSYGNDHDLLALSYAGGKDGMEVTNRLLHQLPMILSKDRGTAYLLLCKQNKPENVVQVVQQWGSRWSVTRVSQSGKTAGWEKLQIIRICRV